MAHNYWHLWNKYLSETNVNIPLTIAEITIPNVKPQCHVQPKISLPCLVTGGDPKQ